MQFWNSVFLAMPVIPTIPAKERWQTTTGGYGNFYVSVHKEVVNQEGPHKECERICASMSKELEDCLDQIRTMRINAGLPMPCRDEFLGPGKFGAGSKSRGVNQCPHKVGVLEVDPYAPTTPNVFNGGELHPLSGHKPRGMKQLTPTYPIGTLVNASSHLPTFSKEPVCPDPGRDEWRENDKKPIPLRYKTTNLYRPSSSKKTESYASSGRGGVTSSGYNKRNFFVEESTPHKQPRYHERPVSAPPSTSTRTLAPSERYNFYRLYGYAGQGAKTSNGWRHGPT